MDDGPTFRAALRARARTRPRSVVFAEGEEARTIEAVSEILAERLLRPILVGIPEQIRAALAGAGADPAAVPVHDPRVDAGGYAGELHEQLCRARGLTLEEAQASAQEPLYRAALMVRRGEADGGVAVAIHNTGDVIRAAHACVWPARGIRTLSSSFYNGSAGVSGERRGGAHLHRRRRRSRS